MMCIEIVLNSKIRFVDVEKGLIAKEDLSIKFNIFFLI